MQTAEKELEKGGINSNLNILLVELEGIWN